MEWKEMSYEDGMELASRIWTIFLFRGLNLFPNPFLNRVTRYRTLFLKDSETMSIYVFLNKKDNEGLFLDEIKKSHGHINLYGACGQIFVEQVRIHGSIKKIRKNSCKRDLLVKLIEKRFRDKNADDQLPIKPKESEKQEALKMIDECELFEIKPDHFFSSSYDRG